VPPPKQVLKYSEVSEQAAVLVVKELEGIVEEH
jgi:hypothetical protein